MKKTKISPFDRNVAKHLHDPEFAASYYEEFAKAPVPLQLAILRRLRGVSQEDIAGRLHLKQAQISRLEREGSDHLLSTYEKVARTLHSKVMIVPDHFKVVPA